MSLVNRIDPADDRGEPGHVLHRVPVLELEGVQPHGSVPSPERKIEELQSGGGQLSLEDLEKTDEHSDGRDDD